MISRFDCLKELAEAVGDSLVIARLFPVMRDEWRHLRPNPPSMRSDLGTTTPLGLGLAMALPHRKVVVIDTDGSLLLNLGALATLGNIRPPNLKVFVMDNECYESTGEQPTATAGRTDLAAIAKGAGIDQAKTTRTLEEFAEAAQYAMTDKNLHFIVVKVEKGLRKVPPLVTDGIETKYKFLRYVEETEQINIIELSQQRT